MPEIRRMFWSSRINKVADDVSDPEIFKEFKQQLKVERNAIKQGYQIILEKIKEISQKFGHAITTGSRNGSGKIVFEHFERLSKIYGSSSAANKLKQASIVAL